MNKEREVYEEWRRRWEEFNRWEAEHPPAERDPAKILADLGAILSWLPAEVRAADPDPEKLGIQAMRRALAMVGPRR